MILQGPEGTFSAGTVTLRQGDDCSTGSTPLGTLCHMQLMPSGPRLPRPPNCEGRTVSYVAPGPRMTVAHAS